MVKDREDTHAYIATHPREVAEIHTQLDIHLGALPHFHERDIKGGALRLARQSTGKSTGLACCSVRPSPPLRWSLCPSRPRHRHSDCHNGTRNRSEPILHGRGSRSELILHGRGSLVPVQASANLTSEKRSCAAQTGLCRQRRCP